MSEQAQTFEEIFAQMSPAEQQQFLQQAQFAQSMQMLNNNQQTLANMPTLPQPYQYQKPDSLGSALRGAVKNLLLPAQQQLGLAPTIKGQLANMQYQEFQRELINEQNEKIRERMGRQFLIARGANPLAVNSLSGKALTDQVAAMRDAPVTDEATGIVSQTNPLTQQQEILITPSEDRQNFNQYLSNISPPFAAPFGTTFEEYTAGTAADAAGQKRAAEEDVAMNNMFRQQYMQGIVNNVSTIQQGALGARGAMSDLYLLRDLIADPRTDQGYFSKMRTTATSIFGDLGLATDRDISQEELMQAITQKLAIGARDTSEGGGMPGSLSDSDRIFLQQMMPQLTNTPKGNALLVEMMIAMNKRKIEINRAVQNYFKENGTYEGFESVYDKFKSQDMFADIEKKAEAMFRAADDPTSVATVEGQVRQ